MRPIRFRGMSIHVDKWCYGSFIDNEEEPTICGFDIWRKCKNKDEEEYSEEKIELYTVGQFTGLYDKNGKEIYEGDIVLIDSVVFDNEYLVVEWEESDCRYIFRFANDDGYLSPLDCRDEITIIGNIFDFSLEENK